MPRGRAVGAADGRRRREPARRPVRRAAGVRPDPVRDGAGMSATAAPSDRRGARAVRRSLAEVEHVRALLEAYRDGERTAATARRAASRAGRRPARRPARPVAVRARRRAARGRRRARRRGGGARRRAAASGDEPRRPSALALAALPGAHWDALAPGSPLRRWRLVELGPAPTLATPAAADRRARPPLPHRHRGAGRAPRRRRSRCRRAAPPLAPSQRGSPTSSPQRSAAPRAAGRPARRRGRRRAARRRARRSRASSASALLVVRDARCRPAARARRGSPAGRPRGAAARRPAGRRGRRRQRRRVAALLDELEAPWSRSSVGESRTRARRDRLLHRAVDLPGAGRAGRRALDAPRSASRRRGRRVAEPVEEVAAALPARRARPSTPIAARAGDGRRRTARRGDAAAALPRARPRSASTGWPSGSSPRAAGTTSCCPTGHARAAARRSPARSATARRSTSAGASATRTLARPRRHRAVRRRERHRQDAGRRGARRRARARPLPDRPRGGGEQVHRRDREEPAPAVRRRRGERRGAALRRGRRAVRQAQRGEGQPRPLRQPRGRLPAAAHGVLPRAGDPDHQPARRTSTARSCAGCASSSSSRSPTRRSGPRSGGATFPAATPTDGLDSDALARLQRPGGSIRVDRARRRRSPRPRTATPVGAAHVLRGRAVEYAKAERALTDAEIAGGHGGHADDVEMRIARSSAWSLGASPRPTAARRRPARAAPRRWPRGGTAGPLAGDGALASAPAGGARCRALRRSAPIVGRRRSGAGDGHEHLHGLAAPAQGRPRPGRPDQRRRAARDRAAVQPRHAHPHAAGAGERRERAATARRRCGSRARRSRRSSSRPRSTPPTRSRTPTRTPTRSQLGIHPQLAALEALVHPRRRPAGQRRARRARACSRCCRSRRR